MPVILVTNDDGIKSEGLTSLFRAMEEIGDAYIVAPDRERSAVSHALTMHRPLRVDRVAGRIYTVNGTPTDCVVVAVEKVLPERPAIVVSGINLGANLGDDVTYSGTVSAAIEGMLFGIPSVAVSMLLREDRVFHFETAAGFSKRVVHYILEKGLPPDTLLNVNVPNMGGDEIKGVKFTRQGKRVYDNAVHDTLDPWGRRHYWIGGGTPSWQIGNDTDFNAVSNDYISVTPIHIDLTNHEALKYLRGSWGDLR